MVLIILIIAIFGIMGYFCYSYLNTKSIDSNASSVVDEFARATTTVKRERPVVENKVVEENVVQEEIVNPIDLLNPTAPEEPEPTEEQKTDPDKVYMKGYEVIGTIEIPKTNIKYPVLEKVTKKSLEIAIARAYGPALNEVGNVVLYGHNYRNNLFFSNNDRLTNGDKIYITDVYGTTMTYIVYRVYETTPNDASYMQRDTNGYRELSLQTCTDDSSGRIIIWAAEDGSMNN
jgi:LPXTG-site transpeptidase (sortase) family protein